MLTYIPHSNKYVVAIKLKKSVESPPYILQKCVVSEEMECYASHITSCLEIQWNIKLLLATLKTLSFQIVRTK